MKTYLKEIGLGTLMALTLFTSKAAIAGERGGNGGDALICPNRIILLDYFELESGT